MTDDIYWFLAIQGDSGGPLTCKASDGKWHVQGVASKNIGCNRTPAVFTDVQLHSEWVRKAQWFLEAYSGSSRKW